MSYLQKFLALRCSGDVLNVVNPLGNKAEKEISESMACLRQIKKMVLPFPMKYTVHDLCAGNALTSVLSAFVLPVKNAIAYDKRDRGRKWFLVKRFEYISTNIFDIDPSIFDENSILLGVHACSSLAERIVYLYNNSKARKLVLMPCCHGRMNNSVIPPLLQSKVGNYGVWCWHLAKKANTVRMIEDTKCLSPKNIIVIAEKKSTTPSFSFRKGLGKTPAWLTRGHLRRS